MDKSQIRHLLDLSKEEKKAFLNSFDRIMFDCDGVLWNFIGPIPGIDKALQLLQQDGKKLAFISNNGMRTMDEYKRKFQNLGVELDEQDIVHPALTTVKYLKSIDMKDAVYCIGTEVFKDYLRSAGFTILDGPTERLPDDYSKNVVDTFASFFAPDGPRVGAVVVDIDANLSLSQLMKAKCYLERNLDCLLLAGATDYIIPLGDKMGIIGPGHFLDILQNVTGRKALIMGKPGQALSEFISEQFQMTHPERTLFIGDMLVQDMGFGALCGFQKLLVLSGGTSKATMLDHNKSEELPNYYADSVADIIQLYKETTD